MKKKPAHRIWMLVPLAGIAAFVVLYIIAAHYYPGGSDLYPKQAGFDWTYNYWCDLLAATSKNGNHNPGRIFSLTGTIFLFLSLAVFWYHLPVFFHERKLNTFLIRYTGTLAMFLLIFMFTRFHDDVISLAGIISAIPMSATLNELKKYRLNGLFITGWICILFILLNFFIYLTNYGIVFLPVIQKITMFLFLSWIALINLKCIKIKLIKPDMAI
jgi:hypothetical protein